MKWTEWADPTWEPVQSLKDTEALEKFECTYGPIEKFNGPEEDTSGAFVGPADAHIMAQRRSRRIMKKTNERNFRLDNS